MDIGHLLFKATNYNWGLKGPGAWDQKLWEVYSDGSYSYSIKYLPEEFDGDMEIYTHNGKLTENTVIELKTLLEEEWPDLRIDACDGEAWELIAYDVKGNVMRTFSCGYIYGIECLENIVDLLPKH